MDVQKGFYADDVFFIITSLLAFSFWIHSGRLTKPLPPGVEPFFKHPFVEIEFDRNWDETTKTGGIHTLNDQKFIKRSFGCDRRGENPRKVSKPDSLKYSNLTETPSKNGLLSDLVLSQCRTAQNQIALPPLFLADSLLLIHG